MNLIVHKECSGAYFWMSPITGDDYDTIQDIDVYSIYDEVVESFLWCFLEKYYDESLSAPYRTENDAPGFEWYLTPNIYTYKTMEKMLEEIAETCNLLKYQYNHPKLDDLKRNFVTYVFDEQYYEKNIQDDKLFFEKNKHIAIDFYHEFTATVKKMMRENPNCNLVNFSGP